MALSSFWNSASSVAVGSPYTLSPSRDGELFIGGHYTFLSFTGCAVSFWIKAKSSMCLLDRCISVSLTNYPVVVSIRPFFSVATSTWVSIITADFSSNSSASAIIPQSCYRSSMLSTPLLSYYPRFPSDSDFALTGSILLKAGRCC